MSLARALARNTAIQIIGKAVSTALGFLAFAILAHYLGTEKFGWYITATGFLQFIGVLIDFGFTVTTSNMLSEPEFDKEKLFNTIFTWRLLSAVLSFGIAPLIILAFPYRTEIKIAVAITSLSFFCNTLNQSFIGYYRQKLSMLIATLSEVLGRVLLVAGIVLLVLRKAGFLPLMSIITLATVASTLYLFFNFKKIRFAIDREISRALFIKMWPTALSVIFNTIYLQADRVILPLYVSQTQVGLYGAAYRVLDIVIQVAAIVMGLLMPLITYSWSRGMRDKFTERYQIGVDLIAFLLFPMIVGIYVLANPLMQLIGGPSFAGGGIMLKWLSISILGTSFGMTFGHIVLAINRQKEALVVYGSDALLSLIGYLIFIPRFGWMGAVGVTIFSEIYAGIFLTIVSVKYSQVFPKLQTILKILLSSLGMGIFLSVLHLSLFPSILVGIIVYGALNFVLGIPRPETLKQIFSLTKFVEEEAI